MSPPKKRRQEVQGGKDDPESDGASEEAGEFQQADQETLEGRKIISARRRGGAKAQGNGAAAGEKGADDGEKKEGDGAGEKPASNPFGGVSLAPPADKDADGGKNPFAGIKLGAPAAGGFGGFGGGFAAVAKAGAANDGKAEKGDGEDAGKAPTFGSFGGGATGFAALGKGAQFGSGGFGGFGSDAAKAPLTFGNSAFSAVDVKPVVFADADKESPKPKEVSKVEVATGEEDETVSFRSKGKLFEYGADKGWHERGAGEAKVNVTADGRGRLVMRADGHGRLVLNARLWKGMVFSAMDGGKGVTFSCMNAAAVKTQEKAPEGKDGEAGEGLRTYALRLPNTAARDEFIACAEKLANEQGEPGSKPAEASPEDDSKRPEPAEAEAPKGEENV
ncbi:unnamed protein product [Pedinophyceae sp. YPF-701]|nr:unnamed protein product [Pedinophyceae sp. YPF-701]